MFDNKMNINDINNVKININEINIDQMNINDNNIDQISINEDNIDKININDNNIDQMSINEDNIDQMNINDNNIDQISINEDNIDQMNINDMNNKMDNKMNKKKNLFLLYNSDKYFNKEVKASGLLFYTIKNGEKFFLMTETNNLLSDIGGKIEESDLTILDIAIREFCEETNACFFQKVENNFEEKIKELINYLKTNIKIEKEYYFPKSKYFIFISYLPPCIMDLHNSIDNFFGNTEIAENRIRKIFWINKKNIFKYKYDNMVHPRIWNNIFWREIFGDKFTNFENQRYNNNNKGYVNNKKIGYLFRTK
jgi:hypothetical protein